MRVVLLVTGLFAGWVTSAGALAPVPPLPPVPPVTVPPLPPVPPAPRPPQVPAVPVPKAPPAAVPPVSKPTLPVGGSNGGSGSSGTGGGSEGSTGSSSSGGSSGAASSQRPASHAGKPARVHWVDFSRDWISRTGPKKGRQTVLMFVLGKPALVEFIVIEISPGCRRVGRFRALGRTGINHVRFRGRIGGRALGPGTYRIKARSVPGGRALVDTKLVIVSSPDRDDIAAARRANACAPNANGQSSSSSTLSSSGATPAEPTAGTPPATEKGKTGDRAAAPDSDSGVLGAKFTKRAVDAVKGIPLWLFILLGIAIAILAVAAWPLRAAPRRAASGLARHRGALALTGAAVLLAVTVAYTLH